MQEGEKTESSRKKLEVQDDVVLSPRDYFARDLKNVKTVFEKEDFTTMLEMGKELT